MLIRSDMPIFNLPGFEPEGREFESLRAHHFKSLIIKRMRAIFLEHLVFLILECRQN
jgi:hypothetical protein